MWHFVKRSPSKGQQEIADAFAAMSLQMEEMEQEVASRDEGADDELAWELVLAARLPRRMSSTGSRMELMAVVMCRAPRYLPPERCRGSTGLRGMSITHWQREPFPEGQGPRPREVSSTRTSPT